MNLNGVTFVNRLITGFFLVFVIAMTGCSNGPQITVPPTSADVPDLAGLTITDGGPEWHEGEEKTPFDQLIQQAPFPVKQPALSFEVTHKAAAFIEAPFDLLHMVYANETLGMQVMLSISNSQETSDPEGTRGPDLENGTSTWLQGGEFFSGLYWRQDGLTYALLANKVEGGEFVPLYGDREIVEIANSLK